MILTLSRIVFVSIDERADACLTGDVVDSSILERSRWLVVIGEGRQTLDVGDRRQSLMGDGEEAGWDSTVDGGKGYSLVRGRAPQEATGSRRGGRGVAHNGVADVLGSRRGGGADARVFAGLRRGRRADVSVRRGEGMEQL